MPLKFCLLLLASLFSFSCNQPFQPVINYKPRLVVYSILFANQPGVYVRVSSTGGSPSSDVTEPVHGAHVDLVLPSYIYDPADSTGHAQDDTVSLRESYKVSAGDTDYYYYSPLTVLPGVTYGITAEKAGYEPVSSYATVPFSFVTIPDINTYEALRLPNSANVNPDFNVKLGGSSAYFVRVLIEYRGFDDAGNFKSGFVDAMASLPADPFIQVNTNEVSFTLSRLYYASQLASAEQLAGSLKQSHMYADIIVTQVDDPLYRFYLTSGRWLNPLAMRTDKVVFSNVTNGDGVVGAAAVDTTRIFLF